MSQPISVVVADDEPLARDRLRRLLEGDAGTRLVAECSGGTAALEAIGRHRPHLLFLDVQMPDLDGFEVLQAVPPDRMPAVIFTTAYDRYALQAFDAQAVDYLLKPYSEARFTHALARAKAAIAAADGQRGRGLAGLLSQVRGERAAQREGTYLERLLVRDEGRVIVVPVGDLEYAEAAGNYVRLHAGGAVHLLRETLSELEAGLDPRRFARIHRSSIVNVAHVAELEPWFSGDYMVVLRSGARLKLSRSFRQAVEAKLRGSPEPGG
jgi:two-component system, LytTR family, response regulator